MIYFYDWLVNMVKVVEIFGWCIDVVFLFVNIFREVGFDMVMMEV